MSSECNFVDWVRQKDMEVSEIPTLTAPWKEWWLPNGQSLYFEEIGSDYLDFPSRVRVSMQKPFFPKLKKGGCVIGQESDIVTVLCSLDNLQNTLVVVRNSVDDWRRTNTDLTIVDYQSLPKAKKKWDRVIVDLDLGTTSSIIQNFDSLREICDMASSVWCKGVVQTSQGDETAIKKLLQSYVRLTGIQNLKEIELFCSQTEDLYPYLKHDGLFSDIIWSEYHRKF